MRIRIRRTSAVLAAICLASSPYQTTRVLTLEQELRIDGVAADLTMIGFVLVMESGTLVVAQPQDFRILFFGSTGQLTGTFGRRGQGPGELGTTGTSSETSRALITGGFVGDSIWVYDAAQERLEFVSRTGKRLRTVSVPSAAATSAAVASRSQSFDSALPRSFDPDAVYPSRDMIGRMSFLRASQLAGAVPPPLIGRQDSVEVMRVSSRGSLIRQVGHLPRDETRINISRQNGETGLSGFTPFIRQPMYAVAQDGSRIAFLTTQISAQGAGVARLVVLNPVGDTVLSRQYPFQGTPISGAAADSAVQAHMRPYAVPASTPQPGRREMIMELERTMRERVPKFESPYTQIRMGTDGTIMLSMRSLGKSTTLLLDARGDAIGIVNVPPRTGFVASSRSQLWAVHIDSLGIGSLVRYKIY